MAVEIRADLLQGKRPLPPNSGRRHLVIAVAAPGSGKTTVARQFVAARFGAQIAADHFVEVDYDDAINYHPAGPDLWHLRDAVSGKPVPVGSTETFFACRKEVIEVMRDVLRALIKEGRYHLVLHHLRGDGLRPAHRLGFHTILLFVGTPRQVAVRRAAARVQSQGRYFTEDDVTYWYEQYREAMAFWALWADEFHVANNGIDQTDVKISVVRVLPEWNPWSTIDEAQAALDAVTDKADARADNRRDLDLLVGVDTL